MKKPNSKYKLPLTVGAVLIFLITIALLCQPDHPHQWEPWSKLVPPTELVPHYIQTRDCEICSITDVRRILL